MIMNRAFINAGRFADIVVNGRIYSDIKGKFMARGSQLSRQWQICKLLQENRYGLTVEEIASRHGYSRRTIERDISLMRRLGIPVTCQKNASGCKQWKIAGQLFCTDKLYLEPNEIMALCLVKRTVESFKNYGLDEPFTLFFEKVNSLLCAQAKERMDHLYEQVIVKNASHYRNDSCRQLGKVVESIEKRKMLQISYHKAGDAGLQNYTFAPYGIAFLDIGVYVVGSCPGKGERTLKLSRIEKASLSGKTFDMPEDFSINKKLSKTMGIIYQQNAPTTVRCRIKGSAANRIREEQWHRTQTIEKEYSDGSVLVSFLLDSTDEFLIWALSYGSWLEVLEPEHLREQMALRIAEMAEIYRK